MRRSLRASRSARSSIRRTERTFVDANTIKYQVTIEDPGAFTRPWTMVFNLQRRRVPADYEIMESACVEGERALAHVLGDRHP